MSSCIIKIANSTFFLWLLLLLLFDSVSLSFPPTAFPSFRMRKDSCYVKMCARARPSFMYVRVFLSNCVCFVWMEKGKGGKKRDVCEYRRKKI